MRHRRLRLLGFGLFAYGVIGLILFVAVAVAINAPLERARNLAASLDQERQALVLTMTQAQTSLSDMSTGIGTADTSLVDAKSATDNAATIANTMAQNMYQLRDAMSLSIFGAQPLVGLAPGFDNAATGFSSLGSEMTTIGTSLDANRAAVATASTDLAKLSLSLGQLTLMVQQTPDVAISTASLDAVRLAVYAICGWLAVLALGCVIGGVYLIRIGGSPRPARPA